MAYTPVNFVNGLYNGPVNTVNIHAGGGQMQQWWVFNDGASACVLGANPTFSAAITGGNGPEQFKLGSGSPCLNAGNTGGNMGAWDGTYSTIGANWVRAVGVYPITADSSG